MTVRRLLTAGPLGVFVAVVAHIAGFGTGHAPGGAYASQLVAALVAAFVLVTLCGFFKALLAPPSSRIALSMADRLGGLGALCGTGFVAYALIELAESHLTLGGALRGLLLSLPAAVLVGSAEHALSRATRRAARCFAGYARSRALRAATRFRSIEVIADCCSAAFPWLAWRGRAPPLLA